ncbi:MAG TPA: type I DNA topoisomerase [Pyrinomonadaceae bacterium]|nr:type I DNA topoisomerase [Chloracidobacterium sp.]MBP9934387.1 type I DNA topoisomerase [Pyrinomonadaceae bacterium]MBK9766369.1 type I DNA topoisomerase [Chloracidobacterium sp.]MBL0241727.1 type I DNA topoisomerase [Chloracidobacterium sp.]HQX54313.1 type I DNA topoisomerase [Pyrinomonadaceae bacterium]
MSKNLLIVESPAKAKTIEKILGKDFQVNSCYGHIRDLEKAGMGIDVENDFHPRYIIPDDKKKVVNELKSLAKKSDEVWLATDEDREGEAISWHLCEVLGLDPRSTKRIVFHEITKPAIEAAVKNPRTVNMNLVMAQQARRVLDRIVGFELSPVLWRKISTSNKNLSAGRVQSVAVRLIADREREINAFQQVSHFKIEGLFIADDITGKSVTFKAEGRKQDSAEDAETFLVGCTGASYKVTDVRVKPGKRSPAPPFTTSTLQQEASRKLGYGVAKTMQIAQKLYENGHISYMRTDSVSLSTTALDDITQTVRSLYGERYHQFRKFKNKNESAQEAHEAIRPTYTSKATINDVEWQKLYELIWKRTMASQMADAELEKTTVNIEISTNKEELTASGEVLKFDGFLKVYREDKDEDEQEESTGGLLPPMTVGQALPLSELRATERFSRAQPRYTEASLVKKLEELGIGRPSTYAPTISTIQKREYVEKRDKDGTPRAHRILVLKNDSISKREEFENTGAEKAKLFPTDLGLVVTDFLKQHFDDIMDYGFTAKIEGEFDEVAGGKLKWNDMLEEFYGPFKKDVDNTIETAERVKGERVLGTDPESGKPVVARMARYGPIIQIGSVSEEEKPRFAKVPTGQSIETITFDEALTLFKLQTAMGSYDGKELSVSVGRFGPYVKWGDEFVSIPRGIDLGTVDTEKAIEFIKAKQEADAPVGEYDSKPITKGTGRFGPFIKWDGLFINVPRRYDLENLTQAEMNELIEAKVSKEANRYIQRWEDEKISVENARWGPVIKFGKKIISVPRKADGTRSTADEAAVLTLEQVKKLIEAEVPDAFKKKAKPAAKKTGAKKTAKKNGR